MPCAVNEVPVTFTCQGTNLVGVLHAPAIPPSLGVVVVVGGPQYRVGSHRQFVLLARDLASHGTAVLRFDCRGMGDSDGDFPGFEGIEPDIAAAVDFIAHRLSSIRHVILWGLCDATFAICGHARHDSRVSGVVVLNPWVRTETSRARAQLKHYYLGRLTQKEFLHKVLRGEFNPLKSTRELLGNVARAFGGWKGTRNLPASSVTGGILAEQMAENLRRYRGHILLIVSGRDLTAREFDDAVRRSKLWRAVLGERRLSRRDLAEADHTFSRREWRNQVAAWTREWIKAFA